MKASDYKKLKKAVEERYNKALEKAENEHVEALAAIEKVWKMTKPNYGKPSSNLFSSSSSSSPSYGSLAGTVRKALDLVPQTFTKKTILTAMQQISSDMANNCNPNSLSGCLHRLKKEGVIEVVEQGRGSSPSIYRKIESSTSENSQEQDNMIVKEEI